MVSLSTDRLVFTLTVLVSKTGKTYLECEKESDSNHIKKLLNIPFFIVLLLQHLYLWGGAGYISQLVGGDRDNLSEEMRVLKGAKEIYE